ncbi:MAG: hypothetical protein KIT34_10490 [Cyanobacteria bacterium TGS_CYA1]|nr:hypothetical protein [Cyanobacteria bacterium TGS_CYA1]
MSELANDSGNEKNDKHSSACARLRLDIEQNQERSLLSVNSISVITRAVAGSSESNDSTDNAENKNFNLEAKRKFSGTTGDTRYALGVDFVITALLAVAGITKVRQDRQETPKVNEHNEEPKNEPSPIDYSMTSSSGYWPNHEQKRQTIIIGINDCLNKIAETLFQDPNLGWLIADINKHRMSERIEGKLRVVSIAALQLLDMPLADEIVQFRKSRPAEYGAEHLVTIVLHNTIDKTKLEETLAPVVPKLTQD